MKKQGAPYDHYWFGRDVKGAFGLCHVHLVPNNQLAKRAERDKCWENGWDSRRTSDRYVLYAEGGIYGYLIIALFEDPGTHQLWTPARRADLRRFEEIADNFICLTQIP